MNGIIETLEEFECVLESYQFKGMDKAFFASQAWGLVQRLRRNGISARALSELLEKYGLKGRTKLNDWIARGKKKGSDDEFAFEKYLENARLKVGAELTYDFRKKKDEARVVILPSPNPQVPVQPMPIQPKTHIVNEAPSLAKTVIATVETAAENERTNIVPGLGRPLKKAKKASEINKAINGETNHGETDGSAAYERGEGDNGGGAYKASLRSGIPDFARRKSD